MKYTFFVYMKNLCLLMALFFAFSLQSQTLEQKIRDEVMKLANELRTNPKTFAAKYAETIDDTELQKEIAESKILGPILLDEKLSKNAKTFFAGKYSLDDLKGYCGISGSFQAYDKEDLVTTEELHESILEEIIEEFSNLIDPSNFKMGIHVEEGKEIILTLIYGQSCDIASLKKEFVFEQKVDSSSVVFSKINTAKNEVYLSANEKELIKEINYVRQYPKVYAQIISQYMAEKSKKNGGLEPDEYKALVELIEQLNKMKPVQTLNPTQCIYQAAKKHGLDMKAKAFVAHTGSDNSEPEDRMEKTCKNIISSGENIGGGDFSPRISLFELLIDDGISGRGHRENILRAEWSSIGVYYVKKAGIMEDIYVQNFVRF